LKKLFKTELLKILRFWFRNF